MSALSPTSILLDGSRALAALMRATSTTLRILADAVDPSGVETLSRVPAAPSRAGDRGGTSRSPVAAGPQQRLAGAQMHMDEPWSDYRHLTVAAVADRLAAETDAVVAVVVLFERANRNRRGVLRAAERELRRREGAAC